jgi:hypothetical protein
VDLDGDGAITNDRPAGLDSSLGRRNVAQSVQIINAFRVPLGLAPIDAALLDLHPFISVDARITKAIPLGGNRRLDLFLEGYNLTNHENLTPFSVNHNLNSPAFLVPNGARPARQTQWGVRFAF